MRDTEKDKRILLMLKIWFYLIEHNISWGPVVKFLEDRINEEVT